MPKRSKAETKVTIERILDAVADQLLRLGYDKMTYTTLSQQTGLSRTGISHHFPKKQDFMLALNARIYGMLVSHLDLDDKLENFSESWLKSLGRPEFKSILRIIFHHIVAFENGEKSVQEGIDWLYNLLNNKYGSESKRELEWLIGKSLVEISFKA
ncbi:TetR family transcriptional regulator [Vibrio sp. VB16]|uniref:TetR family transcriptional regulator n=1 Tax=Vibrio sp. VB16 TaxID=2785746 RepID=UPI0018A023C3|nr:TetR family transcriptional regulator [Vibrio sp. VB16]UGA57188.1 TetR/AcrR family transcriptional regulator [Vibrio sp. VB16]